MSERRGQRDAEQTRLVKDGQGLDHSHRCKQQQTLNDQNPPLTAASTGQRSQTFSYDPQRVQRDPQAVPEPRQQLPVRADAGQHVERISDTERAAAETHDQLSNQNPDRSELT